MENQLADNSTNKAVRVVQLSDCHLFESTEGKLLGLNTEYSLSKVLELITEEQPDLDLVLATGDLSQDGSEESYRRFHQHMADTFSKPVYWLPGNHDLMGKMNLHKQARFMNPCVVEINGWHIIMLDSTVEGEVPGYMQQDQLDFLEESLVKSQGRHVMVCLHHQPVPVGSSWLDEQLVGNSEEFIRVLDKYANVRAVIWGHVHQDFHGQRKGVEMMSVPSTCVQFKPNSEDFAVDDTNPGYRWFDIYQDGTVKTGVSRVTGVTFEVDYTIKGY